MIIFTHKKWAREDYFLNFAKISIIVFLSVYLLGNFLPFYEGKDAYLYGILSVNLSQGIFEISNELLENTGKSQFIGTNWLKTVHETAIPRSGLGFSSIGALFFAIGGYYGLFYLSPILTILLFIFSERISTKLFGKYCGFLTLLFLATNHLIFRNSLNLQTESFFALLFILGCYFLITFFHSSQTSRLVIASIFFVAASLIRIPAVIFLPAEIVSIIGFFVIQTIWKKKDLSQPFNLSFSLLNKKLVKISLAIAVPWMLFLIFWFTYYDFYFDDPFTNYRQITATANELAYSSEIHKDAKFSSLFTLEPKSFENVKGFSKYLLPYQFPATYNQLDNNFDSVLGKNWLGLAGILILFSSLIISLYFKIKRVEILIFLILIVSIVWFYSAVTTQERAADGLPGRYMIPPFILSSMIFSFLIMKILKQKSIKISVKVIKIVTVIILISFFSAAIYHANPAQTLIKGEWEFKNPLKFADRYPLDLEGLSSRSVIIAQNGDFAVDYGVIPYNLVYKGELYPESIELLKHIILDGYDVFIFKQPTGSAEKEFMKDLINNHGFVVKDYSKSFCKIMLKEPNEVKENSDDICLNQIFKRR